jgi:hypothetical protein
MTISATTQGIKPGVCLSTNRPVNPFDGQVIYMTDVDQTAVWDGSQWTVLAPIAGGRNAFINGAMNIWQRGTSTSLGLGGGGYVGPDRWWFYNNGFTSSISQQLVGSTLPQFRLCARIQRTAGQTGTAAMVLVSPQETWNSMRFAGKNVTLSFYARASSGASRANLMDMSIITGTGIDQSNFGGGAYTGSSQIAYINPTLTTSWQRFSATGAFASTATEFCVQMGFIPTGTAGASDWFEVTGIQVEEGSVATPFEFEDFGVTLQKCQRYYQKSYNQETAPGATGVTTGVVTTGILSMAAGLGFAGKTYYSTPMRVSPTVTTYSYSAGTTGVISDAGTGGDKTAGSASVIWQGANGFDVYNLSGTGITSSYGFMYHYTASAEL